VINCCYSSGDDYTAIVSIDYSSVNDQSSIIAAANDFDYDY